MSTIPLITSADGFEVVRDAVASIIASEVINQKAQAVAGGFDPSLWDIDVYAERSNPFELFRDNVVQSPLVNVWYDNSSTELNSSNLGVSQMMNSVINIDCVASGVSKETSTGHIPGDEDAARTAHRVARIVRGILMHGKYRYLGMPAVVGRRFVSSRNAFQPQSGNQTVQRVVGVRISLTVDHVETIGIEDYAELERVFIVHRHSPAGMIIASQDINF